MHPDAETLGIALAAAKAAGEVAKATVAQPVGKAIAGHVEQWAAAKLLPTLRRILPLDEAGRLAAVDAAARLADTPPELLVEPEPTVAAGVIEALQTRAHVPELRALFAGLLASAMHRDRAGEAHPAFVEIIRQLTADEARLFAHVRAQVVISVAAWHGYEDKTGAVRHARTAAGLEALAAAAGVDATSVRAALGNLARLGLVEAGNEPPHPAPDEAGRYAVSTTDFGGAFARACLPPRV